MAPDNTHGLRALASPARAGWVIMAKVPAFILKGVALTRVFELYIWDRGRKCERKRT